MATSTLGALWDTTRMRLLVELGRRGTISGAAQAVGIGQPSASQHIRLLEAAAGQRLVERGGRGSRLTEAGTVLAARAAQALSNLERAEEDLAALAGLQTGTIHLGASSAPGVYLLPDTLGCFLRDFPNVTVEVEIASSGEILRRILAGRLQLAIVGTVDSDSRISLAPFLDDELVGIARPRSVPVEDGLVRFAALRDRLLLAREPGSSTQALVDESLARAGLALGVRWELGSSEAIKRAAREGLGVAFLSRYAVAEEVERGELEAFRVRELPPLVRRFSVATLAGRDLSPAEQGFVETLTRCCAKASIFAEACVGATRGASAPTGSAKRPSRVAARRS